MVHFEVILKLLEATIPRKELKIYRYFVSNIIAGNMTKLDNHYNIIASKSKQTDPPINFSSEATHCSHKSLFFTCFRQLPMNF